MVNSRNFQNGKIYKIWNLFDDDIYVGSTVQSLCRRMALHRSDIRRNVSRCPAIYNKMLEFGSDNFFIELIEEHPCDNIEQLHKREGHYIRLIGTLNRKISGRTHKDYQIEKAEHYLEYRQEHKEDKKEYDKTYRENNVDRKRENDKLYRESHKDEVKEKKYKPYECKCGGKYTQCHKAEHERSNRHKQYLNSLSEHT